MSSPVEQFTDSRGPEWRDSLGVLATRSLQLLIIATVGSAVIATLVTLRLVAIPLFMALILASAFSPLVLEFQRWGLPRSLSAAFCLFISLVVVAGLVGLVILPITSQWGELTSQVSHGFREFFDWLASQRLPIDNHQLLQARDLLLGFLASGAFANGALSGVSTVSEIAAGVALTVVILFFLLKDGEGLWAFFASALPSASRPRLDRLAVRTVATLGGYVRGTATVAAIDAAPVLVTLAWLRVPLTIPLTVMVLLGGFIPVIGATATGAVAALVVLFSNGVTSAIVLLLVVIVVNQIEGNLLQPVIMSSALKLHPLMILCALTTGTVLGGVIGAAFSVPIAAVGWSVFQAWVEGPDAVPRGPHWQSLLPVQGATNTLATDGAPAVTDDALPISDVDFSDLEPTSDELLTSPRGDAELSDGIQAPLPVV